MPTVFDRVMRSAAYQGAKKQLIDAIRQEISSIAAPRAAHEGLSTKDYEALVTKVGQLRGRDLYYKWVGSGAGNGPFIELADGSVKYDLITGIGVNFFGHGNLELFEAEIDGLWCDVMQGNLGPGPEYGALMESLLQNVGADSRLKHVWLTTCGGAANEIALKIVRQKKAPASKVFAFKDCFAGRTTAMQEITDNPKYREGQPVYGEVHHLPFFDRKAQATPAEQAMNVVKEMKERMAQEPGRYACLEFELVQGEGGFNDAPKEFWKPLLEETRKLGLLVWCDEIQTFGRTGEIFAYQRYGLDAFIDVVTVAKLLQVGAAIYTAELSPKPGLVSGTFAGSSSGLRAGLKAMELLKTRLSGSNGHIRKLEKITIEEFEKIKKGPQGKHLVDYTSVGGMVACTLFDGTMEQVKKYLFKLWDMGAAAFFCGHGPYRVRMLPPFGAMTEEQWRDVFRLMEKAIAETAKELGK